MHLCVCLQDSDLLLQTSSVLFAVQVRALLDDAPTTVTTAGSSAANAAADTPAARLEEGRQQHSSGAAASQGSPGAKPRARSPPRHTPHIHPASQLPAGGGLPGMPTAGAPAAAPSFSSPSSPPLDKAALARAYTSAAAGLSPPPHPPPSYSAAASPSYPTAYPAVFATLPYAAGSPAANQHQQQAGSLHSPGTPPAVAAAAGAAGFPMPILPVLAAASQQELQLGLLGHPHSPTPSVGFPMRAMQAHASPAYPMGSAVSPEGTPQGSLSFGGMLHGLHGHPQHAQHTPSPAPSSTARAPFYGGSSAASAHDLHFYAPHTWLPSGQGTPELLAQPGSAGGGSFSHPAGAAAAAAAEVATRSARPPSSSATTSHLWQAFAGSKSYSPYARAAVEEAMESYHWLAAGGSPRSPSRSPSPTRNRNRSHSASRASSPFGYHHTHISFAAGATPGYAGSASGVGMGGGYGARMAPVLGSPAAGSGSPARMGGPVYAHGLGAALGSPAGRRAGGWGGVQPGDTHAYGHGASGMY